MARDRYLGAGEAASMLKVSRPTLYAYVSRGLIQVEPEESDPRRSRYRAADIERLVERKRRGRKPDRVAEAALDWGLPVLDSRITLITGGHLFYRGVDAAGLARTASLEEVARVLWGCADADPFAAPAPPAGQSWNALARALVGASPIERCLAMLPAVEAAGRAISRREPSRLWPAAAGLLRAMAAAAGGVPPSARPIHLTLAAARGLDGRAADFIRAALVLMADHELNASTFAVRVVASTGASLGACVAGGLAALSGPLHGGATAQVEALFDEAERRGDARSVVIERLQRGERIPGFGHPLYAAGDPRGAALLAMLPPEPLRDGLVEAVDEIAGVRPNIDCATVAMRRVLGLPRGAALALFAIGRTAGWIAHALEQQADGKLIRPRARYVGVPPETAPT